jgi:hypothetical protein
LKVSAWLLIALAAVAPSAATAVDRDMHDYIVTGGPWGGLSVPCTKATVSEVAPRLTSGTPKKWTKADFAGGVQVSFKIPRGYKFINTPHAINPTSVTHYQDEPENGLMMSEKVGDPVQVCLMDYPIPQYDAQAKRWVCNPDTDGRGAELRVYDYKRHRAYYGQTTEHGCGGA